MTERHDVASGEPPLWSPGAARVAATHIYRFARELRDAGEVDAIPREGELDYARLHGWSVAHPERFWPAVWHHCGVIADDAAASEPWETVVVGSDRMAPPDPSLGPRWFVGARLNFAENLLRFRDEREALVSWNETGRRSSMSYAALFDAVGRVASALRAEGIVAGDRVAAFMPNIPETVVAMLATASLGAIWSSCSPDFGVGGVLDRFGQIAPRVLIACDGYRYAGKEIDTLPRVAEIVPPARIVEQGVEARAVAIKASVDEARDAVDAVDVEGDVGLAEVDQEGRADAAGWCPARSGDALV